LACSDAVKGGKTLKDTLETTQEITKWIKFSPKREAIFQEIKRDTRADLDTPDIHLLCPTRWTIKGNSLINIFENYSVLFDTFDKA